MDGSGAVRITDTSGKLQGTPRWSPDGQWIAYDALEQSGEYGIYVIDAAGGSPRPLTARGVFRVGRETASGSISGRTVAVETGLANSACWWNPGANVEAGGIAAWESWDGCPPDDSRGGALYSRALTGGPEQQVLPSILNREFFPTRTGSSTRSDPMPSGHIPMRSATSPTRPAGAKRCTDLNRWALLRA